MSSEDEFRPSSQIFDAALRPLVGLAKNIDRATSGMASENLTTLSPTSTFNTTSTYPFDTNDSAADLSFLTVYRVVGYSQLAFTIIGPPLQLLVLILGTQLYRRWGQKTQLVVLSMTCGDLIVSSIHSPLMFGFFALDKHYSYGVCLLKYLATYIGCIASSLSLLLLNVDKFIYLHKPLHYSSMMTSFRMAILIAFLWIIAICWTILILLGPATEFGVSPGGACKVHPKNLSVYMCFVILFLTLPTVVSFSISLYIRYLVTRAQRLDKQVQREMSHLNGLSDKGLSRKTQIVSSLRSVAFVFSATIWTCCTVLPYRIGYILAKFRPEYTENLNVVIALLCMFIFVSMNPVGNPIVVIITQRMYIQHIKNKLSKLCGKGADYTSPMKTRMTETGSICYSY